MENILPAAIRFRVKKHTALDLWYVQTAVFRTHYLCRDGVCRIQACTLNTPTDQLPTHPQSAYWSSLEEAENHARKHGVLVGDNVPIPKQP